jgi:hypothetical protein
MLNSRLPSLLLPVLLCSMACVNISAETVQVTQEITEDQLTVPAAGPLAGQPITFVYSAPISIEDGLLDNVLHTDMDDGVANPVTGTTSLAHLQRVIIKLKQTGALPEVLLADYNSGLVNVGPDGSAPLVSLSETDLTPYFQQGTTIEITIHHIAQAQAWSANVNLPFSLLVDFEQAL